MQTMTPSPGRIVLVRGIQANSNGSDVAPAIITRAWSNDLVNVLVFPDCAAPVPATSVALVDDEAAARALQDSKEYPATVAYWPPRV
jgi:hypothetical protein